MRGLLTHVSHRAMACEFVVYLPAHVATSAVDAVVGALDRLQSIESRLTVYDANSEVSRINRFAGKAVKVSRDTIDLIARSLELSRMTAGAFDITAGPLVDAWGFSDRRGQRPSEETLQSLSSSVGYQMVDLDRSASTVRLQRSGMKLNLGAIGKGHAMDLIAAKIGAAGVTDFLMHAGASSVIARGHEDESKTGWQIGIAHPTLQTRTLGHIRLIDTAMATSGSGRQFFHYRGKRYGHVIDPRSGQPAGDALSLTLLADDAATADAMATAMFVMNVDERAGFEFPTLVVTPEPRQDDVAVSVHGGLQWKPAE